MTRPRTGVLVSVVLGQEAGVAAGVLALPLVEATVTLLPLLHLPVAAEAGSTVVLLEMVTHVHICLDSSVSSVLY